MTNICVQELINKMVAYFGEWKTPEQKKEVALFLQKNYLDIDGQQILKDLQLSLKSPPLIKDIVAVKDPMPPRYRAEEAVNILPAPTQANFQNKTAKKWWDTCLKEFGSEYDFDRKPLHLLTQEEKEKMKSRAKLYFEVLFKLLSGGKHENSHVG